MATTDAPFSIWSPDGTEPNKLKNLLRTMALSIHAAFVSVSPSGLISAYAGPTAPAGWLLCDGSAVSRTTYAALFAAIGTTYGSGDGSTTFNVPNYKGRVPVGRDGAQGEFDTLGESGGAKTHTLTEAQIPAARVRGGNTGTSYLQSAEGTIGSAPGARWAPWFGGGFNSSDNVRTTGGGQAHNNLQPYLVTNFIIKA